MDNFTIKIVSCDNDESYDEQDYKSSFECVLSVELTYVPTNKSMIVKYHKMKFEKMKTLKERIINHVKKETKLFYTGEWEQNKDKDGYWYVNKTINALIESDKRFKAWKKQTEEFQEILDADYESFMRM